jgi:hypothetical protein
LNPKFPDYAAVKALALIRTDRANALRSIVRYLQAGGKQKRILSRVECLASALGVTEDEKQSDVARRLKVSRAAVTAGVNKTLTVYEGILNSGVNKSSK